MNKKNSLTITNDPNRPFGLTGQRMVCKNSLNSQDPEIDQHLDEELRDEAAGFKADLSKLVGDKVRPTDEQWTGSQMPNGTWVSSQEICYEIDAQRRRFEHGQFVAQALQSCDLSPDNAAQYALNILSNVRDGIQMGIPAADVMYMIGELQVVIDQRLATKDEHGRRDFAPGEQNRKTQAKLNYLAKERARG